MAEEFEVITPPGFGSEGGGEIPPETLAAIQIVADNIESIVQIANSLDEDGNVTVSKVDGNVSEIRLLRKTEANWLLEDPILTFGELGVTLDKSDPYELKLGDNVRKWSELNNILLISDFPIEDLEQAVDDAEAARDEATAQATNATNASDSAQTAATNAAASAVSAQDWATAPVTTPLPGGKKSAEVNAAIAAEVAATSRNLPRTTGYVTASETFLTGFMYKKRRVTAASNIVVTIPPNMYSNVSDAEAWAIYRKEGSGNIQFVPSGGGSDLLTPTLLHYLPSIYRNKLNLAATNISYITTVRVPNTTAGKLVVVVQLHTSDSVAKVATVSLSGGLTAVQKFPINDNGLYNAAWAVFDADLIGFVSADVNITVNVGTNVHLVAVHAYTVEGHGGPMLGPWNFKSPSPASSVVGALTGLPEKARLVATAAMRGADTNSNFANWSTNTSLVGQGVSSGQEDTDVNNTQNFKNMTYGSGQAVNNTAGAFTIQANFASAYAVATMIIFGYPAAAVVGAGDVVLHTEDGRDTLSVVNGEAELWFDPNGRDVWLKTPKP